jgi:CRISPR-associated protein Cas1
MLTLPDLRQKQILIIQAEDGSENKIRFHNENLVFLKDNKVENRISCHRVFSVLVIGNLSITTELIRQSKNFGICLGSEGELEISKRIVLNKIRNQFRLLDLRNIESDLDFDYFEEKIGKVCDAKRLLGIEGNFSKDFFKLYFKDLGWYARMPRVKPDIPNFLLDLGYTVLFNFVDSLLCLFGFDTYKGFYHKLFFQRKSLVCDVVEPFRCIIDKELLKMSNLKMINEKDFFLDKDNKVCAKSYLVTKKYLVNFSKAVLDERENIYLYVQGLYRFVMDDKKNDFPYFNISR